MSVILSSYIIKNIKIFCNYCIEAIIFRRAIIAIDPVTGVRKRSFDSESFASALLKIYRIMYYSGVTNIRRGWNFERTFRAAAMFSRTLFDCQPSAWEWKTIFHL